ncbi:hypothetical protein TNCV_1219121 [Trichonephila clavipes]|nr:hypothetical protein TNCV_1219121 [Trichonephila clavipes]
MGSPSLTMSRNILKGVFLKGVDGGVTPGSEFAFLTGGFSGRRKREKAPRNGLYVRFKADRTTSKRIRNGFITVKSTTLIGLNSPRKNTTLPAIRHSRTPGSQTPGHERLSVTKGEKQEKRCLERPNLGETLA